jgi:hypothetical protein
MHVTIRVTRPGNASLDCGLHKRNVFHIIHPNHIEPLQVRARQSSHVRSVGFHVRPRIGRDISQGYTQFRVFLFRLLENGRRICCVSVFVGLVNHGQVGDLTFLEQ